MKKSVIIFMHIIFWLAIISTKFITPILANLLSPFEFGEVSLYVTLFLPLFFYTGYFGVMKIKWKKNYLLFSIIGIVAIYIILYFFSKKTFTYALIAVSTIFLWTIIGCLFRFYIDWFEKKNKLLVLEKENLKSSIALMQSQVNPHFLFNTLHNIDPLIFENQKIASNSLIKLSDIMRYMLQETKQDFVELKKEIEYIKNYLSLEQMRLKNRKFLHYSFNGDFNGFFIAPMILIPFVENAFKHSVDSIIDNGIEIELKVINKKLFFSSKNQFDKFETDMDKSHGIGLETVKKRLDLLYKNRYNLVVNIDKTVYNVNLELELNEN